MFEKTQLNLGSRFASVNKVRATLMLLVASLAVWLFIIVGMQYAVNTKADQNSVSVQFNPDQLTATGGGSTPFQMSVTTVQGSGINKIDATINTTGPITLSQTLPVSSSNPNVVFVSGGNTANRFPFSTDANVSDLPSSVIVPFEIVCTGLGEAKIELDKQLSQFGGTAQGGIFGIDGSNIVTVNCGSTESAKASVSFDPTSQNGTIGAPFSYKLILKPDGQTGISGFNISIKYNPDNVSVTDVKDPFVLVTSAGINNSPGLVNSPTPGTPVRTTVAPTAGSGVVPTVGSGIVPTVGSGGRACTVDTDCPAVCLDPTNPACQVSCVSGVCQVGSGGGTPNPAPTEIPTPTDGSGVLFTKVRHEVDPVAGMIYLSYIVNAPDSQLPKAVAFDITLNGQRDSAGKLEFDKSEVTGNIVGDEYDVVATPADYTIGQGGGGGSETDLKLNLKIRLQGVASKPSRVTTIPVKIGLGDGSLTETIYQTGDFTSDENGIWSGSVTFKAQPGEGYKITVKHEFGLQKRICDANADDGGEGREGLYDCTRGKISLLAGDNNLDFSNVAILVGDIGEQNSIANSGDILTCRLNLGKTDPQALDLADVNYDGEVNVRDCSAILSSMSKRLDQY